VIEVLASDKEVQAVRVRDFTQRFSGERFFGREIVDALEWAG